MVDQPRPEPTARSADLALSSGAVRQLAADSTSGRRGRSGRAVYPTCTHTLGLGGIATKAATVRAGRAPRGGRRRAKRREQADQKVIQPVAPKVALTGCR